MSNKYLPIGIPLDNNPTRIPTIELPIKSKSEPFAEIMALGCIHFGHEDQSLNHLLRHFNILKHERHMRGISMGDLCDLTQFRSGYLGESDTVKRQILNASQHMKPVAKKFDVAVYGNHDARLSEAMMNAFNWMKYFFGQMGSRAIVGRPQRGQLVVFRVGRNEYPTYIFHSRTGAIVNEFLALQRAAKNMQAPLIIGGHVHRLGQRDMTYAAPTKVGNDWYLQYYRAKMVLSGCFLRYPGYSEEKAYPVPDVGAPVIRLGSHKAYKPYIEVVDPEIHYPNYFRNGTVPRYQPDRSFDLDQDAFEWQVRERLNLKLEDYNDPR